MDSTNGTLETLYTLVGKTAVLLPLPFGEKRPTNGAWQRTTFERTQEPDYQNDLEAALKRQGNIGVLLAAGLATIDIDGDQDAVEFLALNPKLEETLRTRGARGCNLWIRPSGDYPAQIYCLKKIDGTVWGEWRGGGGQTVLGGQHPSGVRYQRLVEKPAIQIAFSEIVWPANLVLPWVKKERPALELDKRICGYVATMEGAISGQGGHRHDVQSGLLPCERLGAESSRDDALPASVQPTL